MRPVIATLLVLLLLSLQGPNGIIAHANLLASEPAANARLTAPPAELVLHFSQDLKPEGSFIQLVDEQDTVLPPGAKFDAIDRRVMRLEGLTLGPGSYTVRWQSLSAQDDDYADGQFQFVILNPDGSGPVASGPNSLDEASDDGSALPLILAGAASLLVVALAIVWAVRGRKAAS